VEDLAPRFAQLLESVATKVRSATVDRAATGVKVAALALPVAVLAVLAVVFLFMTIHAALAIPLGRWGAYAVEAGVFAAAAALLWRKRTSEEST
jgi:protein-S-isoprenylcysteine O-methyltransferase Ste14